MPEPQAPNILIRDENTETYRDLTLERLDGETVRMDARCNISDAVRAQYDDPDLDIVSGEALVDPALSDEDVMAKIRDEVTKACTYEGNTPAGTAITPDDAGLHRGGNSAVKA